MFLNSNKMKTKSKTITVECIHFFYSFCPVHSIHSLLFIVPNLINYKSCGFVDIALREGVHSTT